MGGSIKGTYIELKAIIGALQHELQSRKIGTDRSELTKFVLAYSKEFLSCGGVNPFEDKPCLVAVTREYARDMIANADIVYQTLDRPYELTGLDVEDAKWQARKDFGGSNHFIMNYPESTTIVFNNRYRNVERV